MVRSSLKFVVAVEAFFVTAFRCGGKKKKEDIGEIEVMR